MKKFKKIRFMYIFLGLSLVSLASVGFANWVIVNTEKTTQTINATIGAVNDSNIKANIVTGTEGNVSNFDVKFDSLPGDDTGLITSGTEGFEKLDFKVVLTIDKGGIASFSSIKVNLAFDTSVGSGAKLFIDKLGTNPEYIDTTILSNTYDIALSNDPVSENTSVPTGTGDTNSGDYLTYTTSISANVLTLTLNYKFKWGEAFGGFNPCEEKGTTNPTQTLRDFKAAFENDFAAEKKPVTLVITPGVNG